MWNVVSAIVIALSCAHEDQITLLVLAPSFESLPMATLSAIILIALLGKCHLVMFGLVASSWYHSGLFNQFSDAWYYWQSKTKDFVIWIGSFVATILCDIALGMDRPKHAHR